MYPLSDDFEDRYIRIEDGYVLSLDDKIVEVGKYSEEVEKKVLALSPLKIIG